MSVWRDCKLNF